MTIQMAECSVELNASEPHLLVHQKPHVILQTPHHRGSSGYLVVCRFCSCSNRHINSCDPLREGFAPAVIGTSTAVTLVVSTLVLLCVGYMPEIRALWMTLMCTQRFEILSLLKSTTIPRCHRTGQDRQVYKFNDTQLHHVFKNIHNVQVELV